MVFAVINGTGEVAGFYVEEVHGRRLRPVYGVPQPTEDEPDPLAAIIDHEPDPASKIPLAAIKVSAEDHLEYLANQQSRRFVDGRLVAYVPPAAPIDLVAYAKDASWRKEVGGMMIGGMSISTDDRSQLKILGSRVAADADPNWSTEWDAADGSSIPIDAPTMIAISNAVAAHVNDCFMIRSSVKAAIAGGTITTTQEIDAAFV